MALEAGKSVDCKEQRGRIGVHVIGRRAEFAPQIHFNQRTRRVVIVGKFYKSNGVAESLLQYFGLG